MDARVKTILEQHLPSSLYDYGFADLSGLLNYQFSDYRYGISLLRKLDDGIIDGITGGPTAAYLRHYHDINEELNVNVSRIAKELSDLGMKSFPVKATVDDSELDDEYRKTLEYKISHKMIATRSGLGWIGKTDLLVSKRFGPRVRLASVLTDCVLPPGNPVERSLCGTCRVCTTACPAQAATGQAWTVGTHRNVFFNPFKCMTYCRTIAKERLGEEISLCGKCVAVCPRGRKD